MVRPSPLVYLFERFPAFTQTFCVREVLAMERLGWAPVVFSIRDPGRREEQEPGRPLPVAPPGGELLPAALAARVRYLPPEKELVDEVRWLRRHGRLPAPLAAAEPGWRHAPDKGRFYEAAWLGWQLWQLRARHVHVHFAGLAARTAFWTLAHWDVTYSLTGHANDIFRPEPPGTVPELGELLAASCFVATESDFAARHLQARFPASAGKVCRVHNGLDRSAFFTAGRSVARSGPRIVAVGRLIEKKGFPDLIDACAELRRRGAVADFRCVIVGDGPLRESLASQIAAAGLENTVTLAGARTQREIGELLADARVFALPCVEEADGAGGRDNLPTVIAEAMAAGLPVVSTPTAGVPEMVAHGETGFLVPARSPGALADALARLLGDAELAARLGRAGRSRARRLFDVDVNARQLSRLLVDRTPLRPRAAVLRHDPVLRWRQFWREQRG